MSEINCPICGETVEGCTCGYCTHKIPPYLTSAVTKHYKLPLWHDEDVTSWLVQVNCAMERIDEALHAIACHTGKRYIDGKLKEMYAELEGLHKRVDDLSANHVALANIVDAMGNTLKTAMDNIEKLQFDLSKLEVDVAGNTANIEELRTDLESLRNLVNEISDLAISNQNKIAAIQDTLYDQEKDIKELQIFQTAVSGTVAQIGTDVAQIKQDVVDLQHKDEQLEEKHSEYESAIKDLQAGQENANAAITDLQTKDMQIDESLRNLELKDAATDAEIRKLQQKDNNIDSNIRDLQGKNTQVDTAISQLQEKDLQTDESIRVLQAKDSALDALIRQLMEKDVDFSSIEEKLNAIYRKKYSDDECNLTFSPEIDGKIEYRNRTIYILATNNITIVAIRMGLLLTGNSKKEITVTANINDPKLPDLVGLEGVYFTYSDPTTESAKYQNMQLGQLHNGQLATNPGNVVFKITNPAANTTDTCYINGGFVAIRANSTGKHPEGNNILSEIGSDLDVLSTKIEQVESDWKDTYDKHVKWANQFWSDWHKTDERLKAIENAGSASAAEVVKVVDTTVTTSQLIKLTDNEVLLQSPLSTTYARTIAGKIMLYNTLLTIQGRLVTSSASMTSKELGLTIQLEDGWDTLTSALMSCSIISDLFKLSQAVLKTIEGKSYLYLTVRKKDDDYFNKDETLSTLTTTVSYTLAKR